MGVRHDGVRYREVGSPSMLLDRKGNEAPPEAYRKHALKTMAKAGIKPAGRPKQERRIGDQRIELCAQGHTPEEIATAHGVDVEAVLRSMKPSRISKKGGQ